MQEQNKSAVQFCNSIHPLWWGLIGSHLIWAFLCVDYSCHSISMCVCSHSSSIQSAFFSAFPPGQTVMCLSWPQTAPPHLLNGDQHKQNISLETYGLIALVVVMEDLWETHSKPPLINKIHFIPFLLQLSIWLLLGVKCAATKRSCSNLIKALLSVGLIVFKVQLLQFFLVLSLHVISFSPILAL